MREVERTSGCLLEVISPGRVRFPRSHPLAPRDAILDEANGTIKDAYNPARPLPSDPVVSRCFRWNDLNVASLEVPSPNSSHSPTVSR